MGSEHWMIMEVQEIHRETPSLVSLRLVPVSEAGRIDFQAGQCVKMVCPDGRESYFAIASEPEEKDFVEFLVKDQAGSAAHELCSVRRGEHLKMSPPFGKGYPIEQLKSKDILLVGIGSGLSPLRSVLKSLLRRDERFGTITLVYGARTPEDIPYRKEFDLWAKKINLHIAVTRPPDAEWTGFVGRVTQLIPELSLRPERTVACLSGNKAMQEEATNLLERKGISKENILFNY